MQIPDHRATILRGAGARPAATLLPLRLDDVMEADDGVREVRCRYSGHLLESGRGRWASRSAAARGSSPTRRVRARPRANGPTAPPSSRAAGRIVGTQPASEVVEPRRSRLPVMVRRRPVHERFHVVQVGPRERQRHTHADPSAALDPALRRHLLVAGTGFERVSGEGVLARRFAVRPDATGHAAIPALWTGRRQRTVQTCRPRTGSRCRDGWRLRKGSNLRPAA